MENVIRVENFGDVRYGRNRDAAFVDAAVYRDVRMAIDDAWRDEHASAVDDLSADGSFYVGADFRDLAGP